MTYVMWRPSAPYSEKRKAIKSELPPTTRNQNSMTKKGFVYIYLFCSDFFFFF